MNEQQPRWNLDPVEYGRELIAKADELTDPFWRDMLTMVAREVYTALRNEKGRRVADAFMAAFKRVIEERQT